MTESPPAQTGSPDGTVDNVTDPAPAWPPVRHPFQVSSMGLFLTLGAGWLLNGPSPALAEVLGDPWVLMWPVVLVISGICGLVASMYAKRDEGLSLLTERLALIGIGSYSLVYTVALYADKGLGVWVTELLFSLIAVACGWRLWQVQRRIRWCKRNGRSTVPRWRP